MDQTEAVITLVQKFRSLQEERIEIYKLFEEGHKMYLATAPNYNFPQFKLLVIDVNQEFKRISNEIIQIEKRLRQIHPKTADLIVKLQLDEKLKLDICSRLHLAEQKIDNSKNQNVDQLKDDLQKVVKRINNYVDELTYEVDYLSQ